MPANYFGTQNGVKPDVPKRALMTLADCIIRHNKYCLHDEKFTLAHLDTIANFRRKSNPAFDRDQFLDYIAGTRTANGAILWHLQVRWDKTFRKGDLLYKIRTEHDEDSRPEDQYMEKYDDCTEAERAKYIAEDEARINAFHNGEWNYLLVSCEILINRNVVGRGGLGGVESNLDDAGVRDIHSQVIADAEADMRETLDMLEKALSPGRQMIHRLQGTDCEVAV